MKPFLLSVLVALAGNVAHAQAPLRTLRVHQSSEKVTLDWLRTTSESDLPMIMNVQEGLTTLGADLKIIPVIAESWSYDETGTVIHFLIRKNAFWSDGKPVTAHDFVAGFKALLNRSLKLSTAYLLFDVRGAQEYFEGKYPEFSSVGVTATDSKVLKVQLKEPNWQWVEKTALPALFPVREDVMAGKGNAWTLPGNLVNNGPFTVVSHIAGRNFVLKPNPHYQLGVVRSKELRFEICSFDQAIERASRGELDLILNAPHRFENAIRATKKMRVIHNPPNRIRKIDFNLNRYPTTMVEIRQSLVQAIDRADLVATLDRRWIPGTSWQLPWMPAFRKEPVISSDRIEARKLFTRFFPSGQTPIKLTLLVPNFDENRGEQVEIAMYLKKKWELTLGAQINVVIADTAQQYVLLRDGGEYHLLLRDFGVENPDPLSLYEPYATGSRFGYRWKDPKFDTLIKQTRQIKDPLKRREMLYQLEDFLLKEQVAVMPVFYKGDLTAIAANVHGYTRELWRDYGVHKLHFGAPLPLENAPAKKPTAKATEPTAKSPLQKSAAPSR